MLSALQNPQLLPGYYSYVQGEEEATKAQENLRANNSFLQNVCMRTMYRFLDTPDEYYHYGLNRFMNECHRQLNEEQKRNVNPTLIYFYNRQLIIQMTSMPKVFPSQEIHVPLDRSPNNEIQVDILALSEAQTIANFNMPFLVVVVEPFSRYIWSYPTSRILSTYVRKAFFLALSRPGIGHDFYLHIREKVQRLVVDGGSEFKESFEGNFKQAFPNAVLIRSFAKSKSGGRPTNTGPVEAAIGTLRRVIRDHEIGVHPTFLQSRQSGLSSILHAYSTMPQTATLHSHSPEEVVESLLGKGSPSLIPLLDKHMQDHQQKQLDRKFEVMEKAGVDKDENVWSKDRNGPVAYRLFLPPNPFSKLVTLRVSLEAYVVETFHGGQNHPYVDLISYGNGHAGEEKRLRKIHMKQLVLVKAPIVDGPPKIRNNLQIDIKALRVRHTPREVSLAFDISPDIRAAVGANAPELEDQRLDNNPQVRQERNRALPRHLQDYEVPPENRR